MENILQTVKDAAIWLLKDHDPEADVYAEEILQTDGTLDIDNVEDTRETQKWYFVEVTPTSFTTVNRLQTEVSLVVSIDYHELGESIRTYGEKAIALDGILRPVFRYGEGVKKRGITVSKVNVNISGGLLHVAFPLVFLIASEDPELPVIGTLETTIKKG